jgi:endonuclease YncB( thermonuclease family)/membrane-bound metal-dependent hydrolase YbcI (DUF457 family)
MVGGVAVAAVAGIIAEKNLYESPVIFVATIFAALLPDIDKAGTPASYVCPPLCRYISREFGHRDITHGIPVNLAIFFFLKMVFGILGILPNLPFFFAIGYASHLLLDLLTISGIPILAPFSKRIAVMPELAVSTKSARAQWVYTIAFTAIIFTSFSSAQKGIWATYNQGFSTPRTVASEMRKTPFAVEVAATVRHGSDTVRASGFAVAADVDFLTLFSDSAGFRTFRAPEYTFLETKPSRTQTRFQIRDTSFFQISAADLQKIIENRPVLKIEIQSNHPFSSFAKNSLPTTAATFTAEHLQNLQIHPTVETPPPPSQISYQPPPRAAVLRSKIERLETANAAAVRTHAAKTAALNAARLEYQTATPDRQTELFPKIRELEKATPPPPIADEIAEIEAETRALETAARQEFQEKTEKAANDWKEKQPKKPVFSGSVKFLIFGENTAAVTAANVAPTRAKTDGRRLFRCVGIQDGDSITVLDSSNVQHKIRFAHVDCPERSQAFGTRAKQFTSSKCFGKSVELFQTDTDKYGRLVCVCFADGENVNLELVKNGLAWHYKKYSTAAEYADAETVARSQKTGLWADASPVPPWDFRHIKKEK